MPGKPRLLTLHNETLPISQWAKRLGIAHTTIRQRIDDFGWSAKMPSKHPPDGRFRSARSGRPPANIPRFCPLMKPHHCGKAYVRWTVVGKEFNRYLGDWGSPEAAAAYRRFSLEWSQGLAELKTAKGDIFVAELADTFLCHAKTYYTKNGRQTGEYAPVVSAVRVLTGLAADKSTRQFYPDDLRLCQQDMIQAGLARKTINDHISRIIRCFAWGVAHTTAEGKPFVPADVVASLREVEPVAPHRTKAPEPKVVEGVPWATVERTLPYLHAKPDRRAVLENIVCFHWITGMRSSALLAMRPMDVNRSATEWKFVVGADTNKNAHRNKSLVFFFGPKSQAILSPLLATTPNDQPFFRFWNERSQSFTTLDNDVYWRLIRRACLRAGVDPWHTHQLRHGRATEVERIYESDAKAAALIGDTEAVAREIYIDPNDAVKRRIAKEIG